MQTIHQILLYLFLAALIGFILAWYLRGLSLRQLKRDWLHESSLSRSLNEQLDQTKTQLETAVSEKEEQANQLNLQSELLTQSRAEAQSLQAGVALAQRELESTRQKFQEQIDQIQSEASRNLEQLRNEMREKSAYQVEIETLRAQLESNANAWKQDVEKRKLEVEHQIRDLRLENEAFKAAAEQQTKTIQASHAKELQELAERHAQSMALAREHVANTAKLLEQERIELAAMKTSLEKAHSRHRQLLEKFQAFEGEILGLNQHHQRTHQFFSSLQKELKST